MSRADGVPRGPFDPAVAGSAAVAGPAPARPRDPRPLEVRPHEPRARESRTTDAVDATGPHRIRPVGAGLPPLPPPKPDPIGDPPDAVSAMNVANYLTVLRIALVPVFAVLLWTDGGASTAWRVAAFAVFTLAALTDRLDGELARRRNLVTDFGKLADPIADKALIGTALVGLSWLGLLPWWVTVVILARELGITALRLWVLRHGVLPASRGGKLKTLLQSVAIGLLVLPLPTAGTVVADVVMAAAVVVTVVTGVDYVVKALRLRRTPAAPAAGR